MIIRKVLHSLPDSERLLGTVYDWLDEHHDRIINRDDECLWVNIPGVGDENFRCYLDKIKWVTPSTHMLLGVRFYVCDEFIVFLITYFCVDGGNAWITDFMNYEVIVDIADESLALQCKLAVF